VTETNTQSLRKSNAADAQAHNKYFFVTY